MNRHAPVASGHIASSTGDSERRLLWTPWAQMLASSTRWQAAFPTSLNARLKL